MTDNQTPDAVLDSLACFAPTAGSVASEWSPALRIDTLAGIIGTGEPAADPAVHDIRLHFLPADPTPRRRQRARGMSVAASVGVLVTAAGVLLALLFSGGSGGQTQPGGLGAAFDPPAGLSDATLGPHHYSYRIDQQMDLDANGKPKAQGQDAMIDRSWVSPKGDIVSFRTGSQNGCFRFKHSGNPSFQEPTQSFFDSLPIGVDPLNTYLRKHVSGSTSREEAVFVAVGDALSTADGLATPRLRAALVGVLSRTRGVYVHKNVRDYFGRAALRADFIDPKSRPNVVASLYFDPATFQLLEERNGTTSQPNPYTGPSPAYDAPPATANHPQELTGAAYIDIATTEKVTDVLPTIPPTCSNN